MSGKLPYVGAASGGGERKPSRAAAPLGGAASAAVAASPSGAGSNSELAALFECPVCYDYVLPPILQCQSGHLVCSSCRSKLTLCPTCRGTLGTHCGPAGSCDRAVWGDEAGAEWGDEAGIGWGAVWYD